MNADYFVERLVCPACECPDRQTIYSRSYGDVPIVEFIDRFYAPHGPDIRRFLAGADYVLDLCLDCGTIWQRQVPNATLMKNLYEEFIDPGQSHDCYIRIAGRGRHLQHAREVMTIIAYRSDLAGPLKVMDFAMGWGQWCLMAKAFGCEVCGTELSAPRIAHARSQAIEVVEWDEIPARRFDLINAEQVFEHIPTPLATLRHLAGALAPGGLIKISVPDGRAVRHRLRRGDWSAAKGSRRSLNPVSPLEHINCFTRGSLIKMAAAAGMRPVRIPLMVQYACGLNWRSWSDALKNLARPVWRNVLRRGTCLYFGQEQAPASPPVRPAD